MNMSSMGRSSFHAMSTFDSDSRKAVNALFIRALFLDLDCGQEWVPERIINGDTVAAHNRQKAFPSKRAAVEELYRFLQATGLDVLGSPILVDSGGGVHVLWPLSQDTPIDEWQPVAEKLKVAAKHHGFAIDASVTADAARVLRTPGTLNWKYDPPKPTRIVGASDVIFELTDFAELLKDYRPTAMVSKKTTLALPGTRPQGAVSAVAKAMAGGSETRFKNILVRTVAGTGCNQLAHYLQNAQDDGMEPLWRALLSLTTVCEDGAQAALKLTRMHPYEEDRMHQKLGEIKGPYTCASFESTNPGHCAGCPNLNRITTPLMLGREVIRADDETVVAFAPTAPTHAATLKLPSPPKGFFYDKNGNLYYTKSAEKDTDLEKEIMLTAYPFYMTHVYRDADVCTAEFATIKNGKRSTIGIPLAIAPSLVKTMEHLAGNSILSASGMGANAYLHKFVYDSVNEASAKGVELLVPPHLGWQADGSFALCDTLYSAKGPQDDYIYASTRLSPVIEATRESGTLEDWRSVFDMMVRKAERDPMVWGHVSCAMSGLGSIFMEFAPKGSSAMMMHISSVGSGGGKTLSMHMANSFWGEPVRYLVSPQTSVATLMQRAGLLHSLPLSVDEITNKSRATNSEYLPCLVFDYAEGMQKIKGSASDNAEVRNPGTWNAKGQASSNAPGMEAMMGARKHTSQGEAQRMLEWIIPERYKITWTDEENIIRERLRHNYGVAGKKMVQWVVVNYGIAKQLYADVWDMVKLRFGFTDTERFWHASVTADLTACILAGPSYADIVAIPAEGVMLFWQRRVKRARILISSNQRTALDILNMYCSEHSGGFVEIGATGISAGLAAMLTPASPPRTIKGRNETELVPGFTETFIETKMLRIHCAEYNIGYSAMVKELAEQFPVAEIYKNLTQGTRAPPLKTKCLKITRATSDLNDGEGP